MSKKDNMPELRVPKGTSDNLENGYEVPEKPAKKEASVLAFDNVLIDDSIDQTDPPSDEAKPTADAAMEKTDNTDDEAAKVDFDLPHYEDEYNAELIKGLMADNSPMDNKPEKPVRHTKKGKKLRKNLGLDDEAAAKKRKKKKHISKRAVIATLLCAAAVYGIVVRIIYKVNDRLYDEVIVAISENKISEPAPSANIAMYIDSDKDGLTDIFEIENTNTDALSTDTDGDGIQDGIEYMAGTNPLEAMSDGKNNDADVDFDRTLEFGDSSVTTVGKAQKIYKMAFQEYRSPLAQYPGVISDVFEVSDFGDSGSVSITVSDEELDEWDSDKADAAVYKINPLDMSYETLETSCDGNTFTANIHGDGVFFVADTTRFTCTQSGIDVMFLIDNSGSMYSKEQISNSEENDVDFKRVSFSEHLIEALSRNTNFGVAKFTAYYSLLSPITSDSQAAVQSLETIKNNTEIFTGTEISESIISAAEEYKDENQRRYLIMITDGLPSTFNPEKEAEAIETCIKNHIAVISISLGKQTDTEFLSEIADKTDGVFFQAANAASFDDIEEKILEFVYIERKTITPDDGTEEVTVSTISDTGFTLDDCFAVGGIPVPENTAGNLLGAAQVNKYYYTGTLSANEAGYNISASEFLVSGKNNLSELVTDSSVLYTAYLALSEKWSFRNVDNGIVNYTDHVKKWLSSNKFLTADVPFSYTITETEMMETARLLTFNSLKSFDSYQQAVLNTDALKDEEQELFKMLDFYNDPKKFSITSFGTDGKIAFELLESELATGVPSVLYADGQYYNAVKLSRNAQRPGEYIVDVINAGRHNEVERIFLSKQPIYNRGEADCQYIAKYMGSEIALSIVE